MYLYYCTVELNEDLNKETRVMDYFFSHALYEHVHLRYFIIIFVFCFQLCERAQTYSNT